LTELTLNKFLLTSKKTSHADEWYRQEKLDGETLWAANWIVAQSACGAVVGAAPCLTAQGSPLTVQPSTGRVGGGNTNPAYLLDLNRNSIR